LLIGIRGRDNPIADGDLERAERSSPVRKIGDLEGEELEGLRLLKGLPFVGSMYAPSAVLLYFGDDLVMAVGEDAITISRHASKPN
jgi:hypothetical protein